MQGGPTGILHAPLAAETLVNWLRSAISPTEYRKVPTAMDIDHGKAAR